MPTKQMVDRTRVGQTRNSSRPSVSKDKYSRSRTGAKTAYRSTTNDTQRNLSSQDMRTYNDSRYLADRGYYNRSGYNTSVANRQVNENYSNRSSYNNSVDNRQVNENYSRRNMNNQSSVSYAPASYNSYSYNPPRINIASETTSVNGYYAPSYSPEREYVRRDKVDYLPRKVQKKRLTAVEKLANKKKAKSRILIVLGIVALCLMCIILIYRQTAIFGMNQEINKLNSEYNAAIVTNEGVQASIDRSVELGNLETVAKNELGMVEPDSSHVFYIDMGAKDEVVKSLKNK